MVGSSIVLLLFQLLVFPSLDFPRNLDVSSVVHSANGGEVSRLLAGKNVAINFGAKFVVQLSAIAVVISVLGAKTLSEKCF